MLQPEGLVLARPASTAGWVALAKTPHFPGGENACPLNPRDRCGALRG